MEPNMTDLKTEPMSSAEEDSMDREPPNYREAECCGYCAKLAYKSKHCSLHNCTVEVDFICDDYTDY